MARLQAGVLAAGSQAIQWAAGVYGEVGARRSTDDLGVPEGWRAGVCSAARSIFVAIAS
jgi:hypothetical protein